MKKLAVLLILSALALAACGAERFRIPIDSAITVEQVSLIKKRTTRKEEVKKILGPPLDRLLFPDGAETWFYKGFNLETVYIEFNAGGTVKKLISSD